MNGYPDQVHDQQFEEMNLDASIYPNPFHDYLTLNYNTLESSQVRIELYDSQGRLIDLILDQYAEKGNYQLLWDGSNYQPGIYFCLIKMNSLVVSKKLVKTN